MKEDLVQYIWQYQLFDKEGLVTVDGSSLNILKVGIWNKESGPDFLQAQIKIGDMIWFGSVEIHIQAKDWQIHKHHLDPAYENVILHVVWDSPKSILHQDGTSIPTLTLKNRVRAQIIHKYQNFIDNKSTHQLACASASHKISSLNKYSTLEKASIRRLERKAEEVRNIWATQEKHWQKTALQWISRAYGFKVNAEAFLTLGKKLDQQHLLKERHAFENIVAYLFEVAGLTDHPLCSNSIKETGKHLNQKYGIANYAMQRQEFRWSRMRPSNFPEIRLVQLASLLFHQPDLIGLLLYLHHVEDIFNVFEKANQTIREKDSDFTKARTLGKESMYNIIINAIIPFRFAYAMYSGDENLKENALNLLQSLPAENNRYTKIFHKYHFDIKSALESQGVLEQYQFACQKKLCLQCPIGIAIMKNHDLVVN